MTVQTDEFGRHVVCSDCGRTGPRRQLAREARQAAREQGWARSYPRGRGEDFYCPDCRRHSMRRT